MYSQVSGNVGIGTPTPTYKLQVAGTTRLNSLNINGNYTLPTTDGGAGFVLRTDGFGNVSWSNPTAIGDITSVIAGDGLINGGTSGDVTLDVNPGDGIQIVGDQVWVNPSALDNPTNGLSVVSDDFVVNVDNTTLGLNGDVLRVAPNGISSSQIADGSITSIDVANNTLTAADIATGAITSDEILDGTILSIDVANNTLTADDIATGAITTDEILDGTIQSIDVANNSLTAIDIATGAVTTDEIADETILPEDVDPSAGAENQVLSIVGGSVTWSNPATLNATLQDGDADTYIRVDNGADDDHIRFFNQNTEHMTIDVTGEVGIGTNTPERDLHVVAAAGGQILASRGDANTNTGETLGELMFDSEDDTNPSTADASAVIRGIAAENHGNSNKGGHLAFLTKNNTALSGTPATERMRITSAGNVGIGEDVPTAPLQVAAGGGANGTFSVGRVNGMPSIKSSTDGSGHLIMDSRGAYVSLNHYVNEHTVIGNGGGNLGVGVTGPTQRLHVAGGARITSLSGTGNRKVYADANGTLVVDDGTTDAPGNSSITTTNSTNAQDVAFNSGGVTVSNTSRDVVMDGAGQILVVVNLTATPETVTYFQGSTGSSGSSGFRVELQRRQNGGGPWTTVQRGSAMCGFQVTDHDYQINNGNQAQGGQNADGLNGDRFGFPANVSISYVDNITGAATVNYRVRFIPTGINKNSGVYRIYDRSISTVPFR
jgi:hypothetical protein